MAVKKHVITNTDTVDIYNSQIGIHLMGCTNRVFCLGVNHASTKETVTKASEIAQRIADFMNTWDDLDEITSWEGEER